VELSVKPAGRYYPALDVVHCLAENYQHAVISNLVANMDHCGRLRLDREPAPVGDCIVETRMGNLTKWQVYFAEAWIDAANLQHALDIVAVARGVELHKEAA
jgi:hypothetical protein